MAQAVITVNAGGSSDLVKSNEVDWATARNAASADSESADQGSVRARKDGASDFSISRAPIPFILTSIPVGSTIQSATLKFTYADLGGGIINTNTCDLDIVLLSSMADSTNADVADYNKFGTTVGGSIAFSSITTGALANSITLNATALTWITSAIGGTVLLGVRNSRDTDNSEPTGVNAIDAITQDSYQLTIDYVPTGGSFLLDMI